MRTIQVMEEKRTYRVIAKVFSNGKITIPLEVRTFLGIADNDYVEIEVAKLDMKPQVEASG